MLLARPHFRGHFAIELAPAFEENLAIPNSSLNIFQFGLNATLIATLSYTSTDRLFPASTNASSGESRLVGHVAEPAPGVFALSLEPPTNYGTTLKAAGPSATWVLDSGNQSDIIINIDNTAVGNNTQFMMIDWSVGIVLGDEFVVAG